MIRQLRGTVVTTHQMQDTLSMVVLDVAGVGYGVLTTPITAKKLQPGQEHVVIHTSMVVREDAIQLVGFLTLQERELFEILQSASGVGLKMAITLLGCIPWQELITAIATGNTKLLTEAKGVGNKLAQRLTLELKDKLKAWSPQVELNTFEDTAVQSLLTSNAAFEEAQAVLWSLGYSQVEINQAMAQLTQSLPSSTPLSSMKVEEILHFTLSWLAQAKVTV